MHAAAAGRGRKGRGWLWWPHCYGCFAFHLSAALLDGPTRARHPLPGPLALRNHFIRHGNTAHLSAALLDGVHQCHVALALGDVIDAEERVADEQRLDGTCAAAGWGVDGVASLVREGWELLANSAQLMRV